MGKIQYIETSQEWICPETGEYKIICVGGGGGAHGGNGGTTAFGTYLSAAGGIAKTNINSSNYFFDGGNGGEGGYTPNGVYGGSGAVCGYYKNSSTCNSFVMSAVGNGSNYCGTGAGYGGGGGSHGVYYGTKGELKTDIITLQKNAKITCTIGKGGTAGTNFTPTPGNCGVIIIEFLGVEV